MLYLRKGETRLSGLIKELEKYETKEEIMSVFLKGG